MLVNGFTASTAELLAGALHDSYPATLLGETTYGKGRTQRVVDLSNGSKLLVSTAEYVTPAHSKVDKVGLKPDVACKPEIRVGQRFMSGQVGGGSLLQDPCIRLAAQTLVSKAH